MIRRIWKPDRALALKGSRTLTKTIHRLRFSPLVVSSGMPRSDGITRICHPPPAHAENDPGAAAWVGMKTPVVVGEVIVRIKRSKGLGKISVVWARLDHATCRLGFSDSLAAITQPLLPAPMMRTS